MTTMDLFLAKIDKTESGCWLWTAAKFSNGYAAFKVRPKMWRAHRWIVTELRGPIPDGAVVMHTCDVKHCVNPEHLVVGTNAENQADMTAKGRGRIGLKNGARLHGFKLTSEKAEEIRRQYRDGEGTQRQIAERFGIDQVMVSRIVRNLSWLPVTE